MTNFRQHATLEVEGLEVQAYSDLAPVTLQRRKKCKFLLDRLIKDKIKLFGGFPFKLILAFKQENYDKNNGGRQNF